jgi:polysaccharide biosynthesis/export protein
MSTAKDRNYCAKLLRNFSFHTSGAFLMELGNLHSTFGRGALALALVVPCATGSFAQTQQQPADAPKSTAVPALPPVQPISQAAVPADQAATNLQVPTSEATKDAEKKDATDGISEATLSKLGAGDLIEIGVYGVPELSSKVRVGNSGDIYLPLIDYVHVGDLTVDEAQTLIEKRLADGGFVRNPHVSIFVTESTSQGVTLLGEVARPGIYPDVGDHKLYEIISEAGGFSATASRNISIVRHNQTQSTNLTLPHNLGDDLTNNVDIFPGDTIMVPRAPIIYVVGDVGRPSGLLVDNGKLTVLQAIALSGGTNRTAKMNGVRIIHKGPTGMTETIVPLKKMLEAKSPDVTLQADDILFVPISGGRVLAGRTFDVAMQAAAAVTVYSIRP